MADQRFLIDPEHIETFLDGLNRVDEVYITTLSVLNSKTLTETFLSKVALKFQGDLVFEFIVPTCSVKGIVEAFDSYASLCESNGVDAGGGQ